MKTLHKGIKSEEVKLLQELLGVTADGDFGPKTEKAVKTFQDAAGLHVDGIVGPATWAMLLGETDCPYTLDDIKKVYKSKGFKYEEDHLKLNITGIRNSGTDNRVTNHYDDWLMLTYNDAGEQRVHCWPITTDPGLHWINHPLNTDGCAILVPGQYKAYKIDHHNGKYEALCQRAGKVKVYRDGNLDDVYDHDGDKIHQGYYGINIHRSSAYKTTNYINKYSAGCQVFADPDHFDDFMEVVRKSRSMGGNMIFTYTLIESKDIV